MIEVILKEKKKRKKKGNVQKILSVSRGQNLL